MAQDTVILLHGILHKALSMRGLQRFLEKNGYKVHNLSYSSNRYAIEQLAEQLHKRLAPLLTSNGNIHFIGHSMGGLLIRAYLAQHPLPNLGRIVMLGTPNQGSEIADFLKNWPLYRWLFGPAGQQLTTDAPLTYTLPTCDVGIIAGNRSYDIIFGRLVPGAHDGKVSVESTRLPMVTDHLVLPVSHTYMPWAATVQQQVLAFLKNGKFVRP